MFSPASLGGSMGSASIGSASMGEDEVCGTQIAMSQSQGDSARDSPALMGTRMVSLHSSVEHIELEEAGEISIGRAKGNNVMVEQPHVSAVHCRVRRGASENQWLLEDCSSNGTFVNKVCVGKGKSVLLRQGDVVCLLKVAVKSGSDMWSWMFRLGDAVSDELPGYALMQELGRGAFSVVRLATHRESGKQYAVKVIDKTRFLGKTTNPEALEREVRILRRLRHPNVTRVFDVVEANDNLYIMLEYAGGGELFDLIKERPRTEAEARNIMKQLLEAVRYLHDNNCVHRDLKLENVLLDSRLPGFRVKLTDFGLSRVVGAQEVMTTQCGTPLYVAPEVFALGGIDNSFNSQPVEGYDQAVDMWALGVIMYVCLAGHFPWTESDNMVAKIRTADYTFDKMTFGHVSDRARSLISQLLVVDPEERLTVHQALQHEWFEEAVFAKPTPPREQLELDLDLDLDLENAEGSGGAKRKLFTPPLNNDETPLMNRAQPRRRINTSPLSAGSPSLNMSVESSPIKSLDYGEGTPEMI